MGRGGKKGGRGGGGRGGGGRGRGRGGGGHNRDNRDNRVSYDLIVKKNEKLEEFYNTVIELPEGEREDFWAALRRELPNSFRFAGSKGHALAVQKLLRERYIPEITRIEHNDGSKVEPPLPVKWYPDELAWWMTTPKNVVRRFPPFAAFQKYLVSETSVGNISRQEVVSMIPPLLMDIEPGMTVLDMCAAPGSKAAQLLEMVHGGEEARVRAALRMHAKEDGREVSPGLEIVGDADLEVDSGDYGRTMGLLIANDSDYKRSHMLIHQLKRLSSPNLIVTNHDATLFPSIKLPATALNPAKNQYLKFDRILADVPCSGDGTCRKNPNLWQDWNPANALGLHQTQVRILVRALQMLKAGGRVVYSTCSMNPVENEAVISSAIERCGGWQKVELVDCSDKLPLLKRKPGLTKWGIMDKRGKIWYSWKEVEEEIEKFGPEAAPIRVVEGMFPSEIHDTQRTPLERCMRVYAHQQDTGGFFIAVLQKMSEFKAKPESDSKKVDEKLIVDQKISKSQPADENEASEIENSDLMTFDDPMEQGNQVENSDLMTFDDSMEQGNQVSEGVINGKREFDNDGSDFNGEAVSSKKLKVDDDADELLEQGSEDREEHHPPTQEDRDRRPDDLPSDSTSRPYLLDRPKNRGGQQFEEPFKYIPIDHVEVQAIEKFYKLSPRFPRDRFMVRNAMGEPVKTIYYTSALIRDILVENEGKGIKFIHGGVRMFMKQDVQGEGVCRWRIQSEGIPILEGYVGEERVVRLYKRNTLRKLLIEMFPKINDGGWQNLGEIGERVRDISMGCCVLRVEPSDQEDGFDERIVLPLWRSLHSLNLMLAKEDRTAMLLRLFNETTALVNYSSTKEADKAKAAAAKESKAEDGETKAGGELTRVESSDLIQVDAS